MSQRLDGVRGENCSRVVFAPFILQKSRMRRRARTDLCGGRSVRIVPTATSAGINRHVVGEEESLRERSKRLHPDLESCG